VVPAASGSNRGREGVWRSWLCDESGVGAGKLLSCWRLRASRRQYWPLDARLAAREFSSIDQIYEDFADFMFDFRYFWGLSPACLHEQFLRALAALDGLLELGKTILGYVHGVVLAVLPPLEVVVDGYRAVCKRLTVFTDFSLNRERNVLEFTEYFGPPALI
jgi:hypothetical protein